MLVDDIPMRSNHFGPSPPACSTNGFSNDHPAVKQQNITVCWIYCYHAMLGARHTL